MDTQQLSDIVTTVSNSPIIGGTPGEWHLVPLHLALATAQPVGGGSAAPVISPGATALLQQAIDKSNAAALTTPAAASGTPVTSNTSPSTIQSIMKGINFVGEIGADIAAMEKGGTATLHWWGWEANLNEAATQALDHLLTTDMKDLAVIAAALAAISPVLAAVSGIVSIVSAALEGDVTAADAGSGVVIKGYLWVGIDVSPAAAAAVAA
jgi:hypothetical protein